jgi:hypothetical protein
MTGNRLERSLRLGPALHLGARRLTAGPIPLGNEPAGALLGDILDANLDQRAKLEALRDWVRRALRSAALRDSLDDAGRDASFGRPLASARRSSRAKHTRKLNHGAIHLDD